MPLTMIEKPEIQEEASFTPLLDGAFSLAVAQPLDVFNRPADDFLTSLTETDVEDKEERDVLDATEDNLSVDEADLAESGEGNELASGLSLYLREMTRVPLLTPEVMLFFVLPQNTLSVLSEMSAFGPRCPLCP